MRYEYASCLHAGKVRSNNEDNVAVDDESGVAVLADGMGGYNAGEVASGMAVEHLARGLRSHLRSRALDDIEAALREHTQVANRAIFDSAHANPAYNGMGTTLVVCVFGGPRAWLGHIGDSRAYRLRGDTLTQLTRDHSLLQDYLDAGLITPEEAATSGFRNVVTRAMGVEPLVEIDVQDTAVEAGDLFLICSDGLTDMVDDDAVRACLHAADNLQEAAERLVAAANEAGGRDNIAVILVRATDAAY